MYYYWCTPRAPLGNIGVDVFLVQVTVGEPDAAVDLLEPIADGNRMCVEYTHVSANVPASFAAPGMFPGLSLPKFGKKAKEESGPKMRQVRRFTPSLAGQLQPP